MSDQKIEVKWFSEAGRGRKECGACKDKGVEERFLSAQTARKLGTCPKCKADFGYGATTDKDFDRFNALSVDDYRMILALAKRIEGGETIEKPKAPKPTLEDFANVVGDEEEGLKLRDILNDWSCYELSSEMNKSSRNRLKKAVDG